MVGVVGGMQRSHKIKLDLNNVQKTFFAKSAGCTRFTYNWALAEWKRQYAAGEKPTAYGLKKQFNAIKQEQFPFITEVSKWSVERAFLNLDAAFKRFFKSKKGYPKFKKKHWNESFYISGTVVATDGKYLKLPKIGWVKMFESLRFKGEIINVVISKYAGDWYASISVELPDEEPGCENQTALGIDLGVRKLVTTSDGRRFENPKVFNKFYRKLKRASKRLSRKMNSSKNWNKDKLRLQRVHRDISCYRLDAIHKLTTGLAKEFGAVIFEDLNVSGMVRNKHLAKHLSDASFGELIRQLKYKVSGSMQADRFFASSKTCSRCGTINNKLGTSETFKCKCGLVIDRDLNAAQNILRSARPDVTPVEMLVTVLDKFYKYENGVWEAGI